MREPCSNDGGARNSGVYKENTMINNEDDFICAVDELYDAACKARAQRWARILPLSAIPTYPDTPTITQHKATTNYAGVPVQSDRRIFP